MEALYVEAVKATTKLVATRPLEQVKLAWGFKHQLEKLQEEFVYIQAFLLDVEGRNLGGDGSNLFNAWLKRVLDLAYVADDLMDDCSIQIPRRRSNSREFSGNKRKLAFLMQKKCSAKMIWNSLAISNSNSIVYRFRMSKKVNHILRSFSDLYSDAAKLGIRPAEMATGVGRGGADNYWVRKPYTNNNFNEVRELAIANRFEFVGRLNDQEEIRRLLCHQNNDEDLSTMAIFGMGGLGKTTLARRVYESEEVINHFGERFWMYVFDNFTIKRILQEMYEKFTGSKCQLSNVEDIIERVQQLLRGKRYLLVLDDVWNKNQSKWNSLKNSLLRIGGSTGSKILVTTRSKDVVNAAETCYLHRLTGLSGEESWAFFQQKAFPEGIPRNDPEFAEIGKRIVKKCEGLPLAISVIGGLLRSKEGIHEWKFIEKSKMWNLPQESNDILPSLLLSVNHLSSPYLKQCFAYCAVFPKDALIDRDDLINLWNAQSFLHIDAQGSNQTPEEVGGKYFDILLNNSLLQAETRYLFVGEVTEYRMHDLVHDLALFISKHDWMIWRGLDKMGNSSEGRHLAIFQDDDVEAREFPIEGMKQLRTLHSRINLLPRDFLMHTRNLRVLKLIALGLEQVPHSICQLSHLRYLDLSHNPIDTLPDSITRLYHLQTLRLIGRKLMGLPDKIYRLINLRHLHLTFSSWCLPRGLGNLTAVQTLPMLELNDGRGWEIGELGALKEIKGLLSISGLEHIKTKEEALSAGICYKAGVSELQLTWGWGRANSHLDVLEAFQPHETLKSLVITGYDGPSFPPWMMTMVTISTLRSYYNLVRIEFLYCRVCELLPALGHLPCLRELSMHFMWSIGHIGDEFYSPGGQVVDPVAAVFPALRMLDIFSFERLTEWALPSSSASAFPSLETLRIEYCESLARIPTSFPSLKHFRVNKSLRDLPLYNVVRDSCKMLISLNINDTPELFHLPDELIECTSLEELQINHCPDLQSLPRGLGTGPCMGGVASLRKLSICDCCNFEEISDLSQLIHLEEVQICRCRKLRGLPRGLETLPCLSSLSIGGFQTLGLNHSFNSAWSQPLFPALKLLRIVDDDCVEVPEWVGHIPVLEKLELKWCKNLKHLPSKDTMLQLTRLAALVIRSCPILQERCDRDHGPEWDKISHINSISINSETNQEPSSSTVR